MSAWWFCTEDGKREKRRNKTTSIKKMSEV